MTGPSAKLWQAILDPDRVVRSGGFAPDDSAAKDLRTAAARLGELLTPSFASYLMSDAQRSLGIELLTDTEVRKSRLRNRFNGEIQRRRMAEIVGAGFDVVALKGFALAHTVYPDPDIRTIGDLDILVREGDLPALVDFLKERGFGFVDLPTGPWGFISEASYLPMMSADEACNIDIHVQPDCYPAYRSLTTEALFAAAETTAIGEIRIKIPSPAHSVVLGLTNAAKDKFGPYSVRKLADIAMFLRSNRSVDWGEVEALARDGRFFGPARVAVALLVRLGLPPGLAPEPFRIGPSGLRGLVFDRLVADYAGLFPREPGPVRVLVRELALCTEPDVALHNAGLRLKGLISPRKGLPPGAVLRS